MEIEVQTQTKIAMFKLKLQNKKTCRQTLEAFYVKKKKSVKLYKQIENMDWKKNSIVLIECILISTLFQFGSFISSILFYKKKLSISIMFIRCMV